MPYCQHDKCPHGRGELPNTAFYWTRKKSEPGSHLVPRHLCKTCWNLRHSYHNRKSKKDIRRASKEWRESRRRWLITADSAILTRKQRNERGRLRCGPKEAYCAWGEHIVAQSEIVNNGKRGGSVCLRHNAWRQRWHMYHRHGKIAKRGEKHGEAGRQKV